MTDVRPIQLEGQPASFLCPTCARQAKGVIRVRGVVRPYIHCRRCRTNIFLHAAEAMQPIPRRKKRPARGVEIVRCKKALL